MRQFFLKCHLQMRNFAHWFFSLIWLYYYTYSYIFEKGKAYWLRSRILFYSIEAEIIRSGCFPPSHLEINMAHWSLWKKTTFQVSSTCHSGPKFVKFCWLPKTYIYPMKLHDIFFLKWSEFHGLFKSELRKISFSHEIVIFLSESCQTGLRLCHFSLKIGYFGTF